MTDTQTDAQLFADLSDAAVCQAQDWDEQTLAGERNNFSANLGECYVQRAVAAYGEGHNAVGDRLTSIATVYARLAQAEAICIARER